MAKDLAIISREIFYFLTALIIAIIGLEILWPNIFLAYFNLNYVIILWFVSGLVSLIRNK